MPGFDANSPAPPAAEEAISTGRSRFGLILFIVYLALYCGFVALNAFAVTTVESTQVFGVNLAVVYGLALIAGAFILAVVYDLVCRRLDSQRKTSGEGPG
jgi:uncharacterized membrane protein (DUF485 family)